MFRWISFALAAVALVATPAAAQKRKADLMLILAMDSSGSINEERYKLQIEGYAAALADLEVAKLLSKYNGTGLIIFEWSHQQTAIVTCMHIASVGDALAASNMVAKHQRKQHGSTLVGAAMSFAETLVGNCDVAASEIILDISGDGEDNGSPDGHKPAQVRDRLVEAGWTINSLPIKAFERISGENSPTLLEWYQDNVNGGNGNFTMPVENFEQLAGQLRRKLVLEISQARSYRYALMQ